MRSARWNMPRKNAAHSQVINEKALSKCEMLTELRGSHGMRHAEREQNQPSGRSPTTSGRREFAGPEAKTNIGHVPLPRLRPRGPTRALCVPSRPKTPRLRAASCGTPAHCSPQWSQNVPLDVLGSTTSAGGIRASLHQPSSPHLPARAPILTATRHPPLPKRRT